MEGCMWVTLESSPEKKVLKLIQCSKTGDEYIVMSNLDRSPSVSGLFPSVARSS